jgi:NAD(P)H-dependent flavin oxidoreductase YrpB (nitropropane dioxygenase family)
MGRVEEVIAALDVPVVQAGMGGGIAMAPLAGEVSRAGGLGTVGILFDASDLAAEIRAARDRAGAGRPVAANLLVPFAREEHARACVEAGADLVVLFCGFAPRLVARLREGGVAVMAQVGTTDEARRAIADGVDGLIAQGREAGGHLLGVEPAGDALAKILDVAGGRPVMAAGGVADAGDVRRLLDAGAAAAVAGSRFLLTEECGAHPVWKQRALGATETVETLLFSAGWVDRHRVLPNDVTQRWVKPGSLGPRGVIALNRATARFMRRLPDSFAARADANASVRLPLYSPRALLEGEDERFAELRPLYAGESVARMTSVVPAAEAVRMLTP